jgi:hypothetical protein
MDSLMPQCDDVFDKKMLAAIDNARKKPSWPRSWANRRLLQLYSPRDAWANLHLSGQPNNFLKEIPALDHDCGSEQWRLTKWQTGCKTFWRGRNAKPRFAIEKMIKLLELGWERYLLELGWELSEMVTTIAPVHILLYAPEHGYSIQVYVYWYYTAVYTAVLGRGCLRHRSST